MAHVAVAPWLDNDYRKGENLAFGNEVIVYQLPLEKRFKSMIIEVLRDFRKHYACKLSVRGRNGFQDRCDHDRVNTDRSKIHVIVLKVENTDPQCSAADRVACLRAAEARVDAFIFKMMEAAEEEVVQMFPEHDDERDFPMTRGGGSPSWVH